MNPNTYYCSLERAKMSAVVPAAGVAVATVPLTRRLEETAAVNRIDIAAMHERVTSILASVLNGGASGALKPKDVYSFFTNVVRKNPNNAQQIEADCLCCGRTVPSTGSYKLVDHIMLGTVLFAHATLAPSVSPPAWLALCVSDICPLNHTPLLPRCSFHVQFHRRGYNGRRLSLVRMAS